MRPRSLQAQLALRLGLLLLAATALAIAALLYQTYRRADSLDEGNLLDRARQLATYVTREPDGSPVLRLPDQAAAAYRSPLATAEYAVRTADGQLVSASSAPILDFATKRTPARNEPDYFRLESFGIFGRDYYGLDVALASAVGPVFVTVADASEADALVHSMLKEFIVDVGWIVPAFVAATLLVGVLAIRNGLKPLREAAAQAAAIDPAAMSVRLATSDLPTEIVPLVGAVNRALDRLEQGFALQRRFTANAAHELRTPLAIITAALDSIEGDGEVSKLREDVARMNRLVDQLLRVARLDAVALDVSAEVDLCRVASDVVEYLAPLAIARGRSLALVEPGRPVIVTGNEHAIGDALRNLVENAIGQTAADTEVVVEVESDGGISVADRGPGVPPQNREHMFDRFWRGTTGGNGSGLGLAIVKEIMHAHGGRVDVADNSGGGAVFNLRFYQ